MPTSFTTFQSSVSCLFCSPKVTYWHVYTDAVGYRRTWKRPVVQFTWNMTIVPDTGQRKGYFQDGYYLIACLKRKYNCDDTVACCGQSQMQHAFISCGDLVVLLCDPRWEQSACNYWSCWTTITKIRCWSCRFQVCVLPWTNITNCRVHTVTL